MTRSSTPLPRLALTLVLSLGHTTQTSAADTDTTTPPRIDLLTPSRLFSTDANNFTVNDLDGDGDQDLIHLPNGAPGMSGDPHAYGIENLGNRQFNTLRLAHLAPTDAGQSLSKAVVCDLIGDSKPEILLSRRQWPTLDFYSPLALQPSLQDAAPAPIAPTVLSSSSSIPWDLIDFDGTGQPYLAQIFGAGGADQTTIRLYKRNGGVGNPFQEAYSVTSSYFDPQDVVDFEASDVDGDGDFDLCVASNDGTMRIFERKPSGTSYFEPRLFPDVDPYATWIDLNGDGRPDLLQTDGSWHENLGDWSFTLHETSPAYPLLHYLVFKKLTPRAGQSPLIHAIVLNEEQTGYELITIPFDAAEPLSRQPVPGTMYDFTIFLHHGDVDGDGHLDLVYSSSATNDYSLGSRVISIVWGSPSGFSAPQTVYAGPSMVHQVFSADFNQDQCPDLVSGPDAFGQYRIHFNRGAAGPDAGVVINGLEIPGATLRILGAATIDKDKYPDLVCRYTPRPADPSAPESAIVVVRGRKDGSFIPPVIPSGGLTFTPGLVIDSGSGPGSSTSFVDWDRDGDLDLISAGLWFENVNGSFPPGQRTLVTFGSMPDFLGNPAIIGGTIIGDLDGDRAPDIISLVHGASAGTSAPIPMLIAFNDGHGGIEETVELPAWFVGYDFLGNPIMPGTAALADLNADKRLDLWIREIIGTDSLGNAVTADRWLRNPGRRSAREVDTWVSLPLQPARVTPGVAFGDFDGDSKPGLLKKGIGEWLSPWGYLEPTRRGPLLSEPYDFTNHFIDLTKESFSAGVDIDADRDTDFLLGGGDFPRIILRNPSADGGKRPPLKVKEVEWLGTLPVVR